MFTVVSIMFMVSLSVSMYLAIRLNAVKQENKELKVMVVDDYNKWQEKVFASMSNLKDRL